jgi:CheY-like chemotaxis protein
MRILIADDHAANRLFFATALTALGQTVTAVADGDEACAADDREPFDLILLDLHMPGTDGMEATRRIRQRRGDPCPPIFIVTADTTAESSAACLTAGADAVITKPLDLAKLRDILARADRHHAADRDRPAD